MTYTTRLAARAVHAGAIAALAVACGGSSSPNTGPSTGGTCTASSTSTTITIANNAVCPQNITVPRGTQVTFVNSDSPRTHEMTSDPHPEHTDCPEINQVGNLVPGQTRQTGNLNTARRCGFHDHIAFENAALKGSITIQ
jgi:plastocyanin